MAFDWIAERNYYMDPRTRAEARGSEWKHGDFDEASMVLHLEVFDEDGLEEVIAFPARLAVCPTCKGKGKYVNPSIDAGGIPVSDFAEDPDFAESYFAGNYDVPCASCDGRRVVPEIDEGACTGELKDALERYREQEAERARDEAVSRAERMMGA